MENENDVLIKTFGVTLAVTRRNGRIPNGMRNRCGDNAVLPSYSSLRDDEYGGNLRLPHKANRRWQASSLRFEVALQSGRATARDCPYKQK